MLEVLRLWLLHLPLALLKLHEPCVGVRAGLSAVFHGGLLRLLGCHPGCRRTLHEVLRCLRVWRVCHLLSLLGVLGLQHCLVLWAHLRVHVWRAVHLRLSLSLLLRLHESSLLLLLHKHRLLLLHHWLANLWCAHHGHHGCALDAVGWWTALGHPLRCHVPARYTIGHQRCHLRYLGSSMSTYTWVTWLQTTRPHLARDCRSWSRRASRSIHAMVRHIGGHGHCVTVIRDMIGYRR